MAEEAASVRTPVFKGEKRNYHTWHTKFMAYARVKGFAQALKESNKPTCKEEDLDQLEENIRNARSSGSIPTANDVIELKRGKMNLLAMAHITLAMGNTRTLNLIASASNKDWEGGIACDFMKLLEKKYAPIDPIAETTMKKRLNKLKLKKNKNPAELIEKIETIVSQYKGVTNELKESDKIALVVEKCSEEYGVIITATSTIKGRAMKLEDLEEAMVKQWRIINGEEVGSDEDDSDYDSEDEVKRITQGYNFAAFNGKCNTCGKTGHKAADCWYDESNKDKRPYWWKDKDEETKEFGNLAGNMNTTECEFILSGINVPKGHEGNKENKNEASKEIEEKNNKNRSGELRVREENTTGQKTAPEKNAAINLNENEETKIEENKKNKNIGDGENVPKKNKENKKKNKNIGDGENVPKENKENKKKNKNIGDGENVPEENKESEKDKRTTKDYENNEKNNNSTSMRKKEENLDIEVGETGYYETSTSTTNQNVRRNNNKKKSEQNRNTNVSTVEAEIEGIINSEKNIIQMKKILENMSIKVEHPRILQTDISEKIFIKDTINWNIKEEGVLKVKWLEQIINPEDILTKKVSKTTIRKYNSKIRETVRCDNLRIVNKGEKGDGSVT